jgi:hypothetical protein
VSVLDQEMIMTISALSGAGANTSLAQIQAKLLAALQSSSQTQTTATTTSSTVTPSLSGSTADLISQLQAFFQTNMSSGTMGGLLQNQGPPPGGQGGPSSLSEIDSDGDGSISQTEMEAYEQSVHGNTDTSKADQLFARMDTDGDGSVSADEKTAFDAQMKAHHGHHHHGPPPGVDQASGQTATPVSTADGQAGEATTNDDGSANLADLLQQLMTAVQAYQSTGSATTTAANPLLSAEV